MFVSGVSSMYRCKHSSFPWTVLLSVLMIKQQQSVIASSVEVQVNVDKPLRNLKHFWRSTGFWLVKRPLYNIIPWYSEYQIIFDRKKYHGTIIVFVNFITIVLLYDIITVSLYCYTVLRETITPHINLSPSLQENNTTV